MRVAHIAIAVADLVSARDTWSRLLNLPAPPTEDLPNQGVTSCAFHLENIVIELVTPLGEASPIANYLAKRGPGIHHVAFQTEDLAETLAEKQQQGFQIIPPREGPGAEGMQVTFLHPKSVAGILVEFVQPGEHHASPTHPDATEHLRAGGYNVEVPVAPAQGDP
ncbi:MAG: hypothetical protein GEEBNDBF_00600 [bacterium]|nr:hypothetical protein [bacterium]